MHKIWLVLLAICLHASDIRISEVMCNPQGSEYENEFIEVFNASDHVMQINGWILSDGNGEDTISYVSGPLQIEPGQYALILDPGYNYSTGPYTEFLNDSLSIYTISTDGSFGSGGLANAGELVRIRSLDSMISSEMSWTSSTQNGFSWERVSMMTEDSLSVWEQSQTINGTPGARNSVTPPLINIALTAVELEIAQIDEAVVVTISIKNTGEYQIPGFSVLGYKDENQNGVKEDGEWEFIQDYSSELDSQDTLDLLFPLFTLTPGVHQVELRVIAAHDEVDLDDSLRFEVKGPYPRKCISITEIMYSPSPDQEGEWVEIQNISDVPVSLQGWTMSDANQTRHPIGDSLPLLEPSEYLCLCASSNMADYFGLESGDVHELDSWPALNSSSDSIRLFDATGQSVAAAYYRGSWGESAISLERRHPGSHSSDKLNWLPSTNLDGGTPSRMNTRSLLPQALQIEEITTTTPLRGPCQAEVTIVFQNLGMDTLYSMELDSDADIFWRGMLPSFEYDSLIYTSSMIWPGYNLIPVTLVHEGSVLVDTSILVVIGFPTDQIAINEIHYNPHEDQAEFLEFMNTSNNEINLRGWSFSDRGGSRGEVMGDLLIQPDSLFVWTSDENKLIDWAPTSAMISELSSWPSLNNSSDSIVIRDPLGNRSLAHAYENPPDGLIGKSLERRALWKPQNMASSWSVCEDPLGITPGRENASLLAPRNLLLHGITMLDSILWMNEEFKFELSISNSGADLAEGAMVYASLWQDDLELDFKFEQFSPIGAGDTLLWAGNLTSTVSGRAILLATIQLEGDEVFGDDSIVHDLYISGGSTPLIINEVMPLPQGAQQEWVELYNRSNEDVDLRGWLLADNSGSEVVITDTGLVVVGNDYLVIGGDQLYFPEMQSSNYLVMSQFPTLNNTEELLVIFDPQGIPMDNMSYNTSTELVGGRSLERIRPQASGQEAGNWGVCIADLGSTPGFRNSLYLDVLPPDLAIELLPNPFSPNGDGYSDELTIEYELPFEQGIMSIMVFDMAGRKIAEPVQIKPVSHRGQVQWDGEANYGGKAVTGLYIMKLLIDDQAGKVWSSLKKVYLIR